MRFDFENLLINKLGKICVVKRIVTLFLLILKSSRSTIVSKHLKVLTHIFLPGP
jgi:hypothetical protein